MQAEGLSRGRTEGVLSLRRHPAEVERGRRHVADACRDLPGDVACTAMLLASELITNALEHGSGAISVAVAVRRDRVRVEVTDESPTRPRPRRAATYDEGGRGLFIVQSLANDWGMDALPRGRGKSVWFSLTTSA